MTPAAPESPPSREPSAARETPPARREDRRKLITVLVVGVSAAGADPEDVRAGSAEVMPHVRACIRHFRGIVQTETADRLLAVFGADRSREDDPERAVRAALDAVAGADGGTGRPSQAARGVAVRAGVATGAAVLTAGPAAGGSRHPAEPAEREDPPGSVRGDVVHLAVTLEQAAAPGMVLAGSATQQATSRSISYRPVRPRSPLERASGLRLWQVRAPRARTGAQVEDRATAPLIERERELALLAGVMSRFLRDREPQLVTLVSEPGLGKSRLVDELGRQVDRAPELIGWRVGRTYPYDQGALGALVEIVKAQAGILDGDDAQIAQRKLLRAAAHLVGEEHAAQFTEPLRGLLGADDAEELPNRRQWLFDGVAWFLGAVAEQRPLVVVFEDLQWADEVLLEFVDGLVDRAGAVPLLVVATGRPEFMDRRAGWGGGQRNAVTISLSPLTRDGIGKLLDTLQAADQETGALSGETREALLTASGGNPLYVEEYVRILREQGLPAAGAAGALPVPTSVQQVIAARIDTLPAGDRLMLQDAAVIGENGWSGALAAVSGLGRDAVLAGLERLQRREFLRRVRVASVAGETEYAFRHALIREVAYGQLMRAERSGKHQRVARWIEQLNPDSDERVELLAHHYSRALDLARAAGQPAQALAERSREVSGMAGDRATRIGSFAAAARAYREALALLPTDDPTRAELLVRLGQALAYSEHAGEDVLGQARQAALARGRDDLVAEADSLLTMLARVQGDWAATAERTRSKLDSPHAGASILSALGDRAIQLQITDHHAEAVSTAEDLVALARRYDRPEHQGNGLHIAGVARVLAGDLDGLAGVEQGMALMDAHRFPLRVHATWGLAVALWWYGDLGRCAAAVGEGRRLAETTSAALAFWFDSLQAALEYAAGRWDAARAAVKQTLAQEPLGGRVYATCLLVGGRIALADGRHEQALADTGAALEAIPPDDARYRQATRALRGRCLLAVGRRDEAAACLDELLADQRKRPAGSTATIDEAMLLLDLDLPADALPDGLPPTSWHQAVRALVARDFHQAADLLAALGSQPDADAVRVRLGDA